MADILLTTLSDALMAAVKTTPLKASTKTQADKTAQAIINAMPDKNSMRAGLIMGLVEKALAAKDPGNDEPWTIESEVNGVVYEGQGDSLATAGRAILADIES
jgi:hypothetical protein